MSHYFNVNLCPGTDLTSIFGLNKSFSFYHAKFVERDTVSISGVKMGSAPQLLEVKVNLLYNEKICYINNDNMSEIPHEIDKVKTQTERKELREKKEVYIHKLDVIVESAVKEGLCDPTGQDRYFLKHIASLKKDLKQTRDSDDSWDKGNLVLLEIFKEIIDHLFPAFLRNSTVY